MTDRSIARSATPAPDDLRARIRQVVDQFGGGAISDEDADAAAGVLYSTPPETPASTGGGEAEPTCRDCGLTREQIDWGWHSAPYEGQFAATPPAPTPASEDELPYTLALTLRRLVHAWDDGLPVTDYVEALRSFVATERPAEPKENR